MEKILLPSLRWWLCFESHVSMQHIYGIAILLLGCGALIGIILWLESLVTKAEKILQYRPEDPPRGEATYGDQISPEVEEAAKKMGGHWTCKVLKDE